jgi:hypothetical protein
MPPLLKKIVPSPNRNNVALSACGVEGIVKFTLVHRPVASLRGFPYC